jgi:hypothetical protein
MRGNAVPKLLQHTGLMFLSVLLAIPVVRFIAGVVLCEECRSYPVLYLMAGVFHALMTTVAMGNIWVKHDEFISGWPYIVPTGIAIYVVLVALRQRRP